VGVLTDYFRAPDAATVLRIKDVLDGPLSAGAGLDGVQEKGIAPRVVLGKLVAFIHGVPWGTELVLCTLLRPPAETAPTSAAQYDALPENSPWRTRPWLEELGLSVRETLARLDDTRIPGLAVEWAQIEEFGGWAEAGELQTLIGDLVALTRRAREVGDQRYCWTCL
jgi:hypothetical protein